MSSFAPNPHNPTPLTPKGRLARIWMLAAAIVLFASLFSAANSQTLSSLERPKPRPNPNVAVVATPDQSKLTKTVTAANVPGETSAVLIDVATGAIIEAYQPDTALPPASVNKVITALYGMSRLGRDYGFKTHILATGPIIGGIIQGDLILAGGGDPELDTDELGEMIGQLADHGIGGISGDFLYHDTLLPRLRHIDDGQPSNAAYNPGLSGLNLNFNRVYFEWKAADGDVDLRLEARDKGHSPSVSAMQIVAVDRPGPVYLYSEIGGADHWSIARGALKNHGGVWLPVRDPGTYAADTFVQLAKAYGIELPPPERTTATPQGTLLAATHRRPLFEVNRGMLHYSTNVTAELVGLMATNTSNNVADLSASGTAMANWAREEYALTSPRLHDHSGLSDANRISAKDMANLIAKAEADGRLEGLLRQHFVAKPGTNKPAVRLAEIRAKTGTLNFVRGLGGTIKGARGQRLAFAIFSADMAARAQADHTRTHPPGSRRFNRQAVALERRILSHWVMTHAN